MTTKNGNPPNIWTKLKDFIKNLSLPYVWPEAIALMLVFIIGWGFLKQLPSYVTSAWNGTPTPTATPIGTPTPPAESIYLKVPTEEIAQLDSFSNETFSTGAVAAKMIVVVKETVTAVNGSAAIHYQSEQICVSVEAFLDKDNVRANGYDAKKVKYVLIILKTEDLARYGQMVPDKVQIYLVPDLTCGNGSD